MEFWRCRRKLRLVPLFSTLFLCIIFLIIYAVFANFKLNITDDSFLETSKCPACYGQDLCPEFDGLVKNITITADAYSFRNVKNVYFGMLGDERIVLKKLASDWELNKLDEFVCNLNNWFAEFEFFGITTSSDGLIPSNGKCRWGTIQNTWEIISQQQKQAAIFELAVKYGKSSLAKHDIASDAIQCESKRFLTSVLNNSSIDGPHIPSVLSKLMFLLINPEPIFLQIFNPVSSVFPRLLGACGRVIVEEYVGPTIGHFKSSPLYTRLKIAKQLLYIADELTFKRPMGYNFYMTDVTYDNFAVAQNGKDLRVVLIDAEGILVTDPHSLEETSAGNPHLHIYANPFGGQNARLQFSSTDLCHHSLADHNFYAVCECLLSAAPCTTEIPGGILWGLPNLIEDKWHIRMLIQICQAGSQDRIKVARKLMNSISDSLKWLEANKMENFTFENL